MIINDAIKAKLELGHSLNDAKNLVAEKLIKFLEVL